MSCEDPHIVAAIGKAKKLLGSQANALINGFGDHEVGLIDDSAVWRPIGRGTSYREALSDARDYLAAAYEVRNLDPRLWVRIKGGMRTVGMGDIVIGTGLTWSEAVEDAKDTYSAAEAKLSSR